MHDLEFHALGLQEPLKADAMLEEQVNLGPKGLIQARSAQLHRWEITSLALTTE